MLQPKLRNFYIKMRDDWDFHVWVLCYFCKLPCEWMYSRTHKRLRAELLNIVKVDKSRD